MTASTGEGSGTAGDDDVDGLGYADAVAELEAILAEIEDDAVDIDQLSRQVRRAAALIRLCQDRIAGARIEVERVVADLAAGLDGDSATTWSAADQDVDEDVDIDIDADDGG